MKKIFNILLAVGVLFSAGCTKDKTDYYDFGSEESSSDAFFKQNSISFEYPTGTEGEQVLDLHLYRANNDGDVTVGLNYTVAENALEFISIPDEVTFKDGEYEVAVPVTVYDVENFAKGTVYTASISLGDHHEFKELAFERMNLKTLRDMKTRAAGITTYTTISLSFSLELQWEQMYTLKDYSRLLEYDDLTEADFKHTFDANGNETETRIAQAGVYTYTTFFEGDDDEIGIEHAAGTNVFRLTNWGYGVNLIFTIDDDPDHMVTAEDGQKYYRVVITETYIGYDHSSYGPIYTADVPNYLGNTSDNAYNAYPIYWDGNRTFYLYMISYEGGGGYFGLDYEYLVLSTGEPMPEVEISYGKTTSEMGVSSYNLSFTPNSDVASYKATVVRIDPQISKMADSYAQAAVYEEAVAALAEEGVEEGDPLFDAYIEAYFEMCMYYYYEQYYVAYLTAIENGYIEDLVAETQEAIEAGTFSGEFPVLSLTDADSRAWNFGTEKGEFVAIAVSYDTTKAYSQTDYKVFNYNPAADASSVFYEVYFEPYTAPYYGYFDDNSINLYLISLRGDLTSVKYAILSDDEFSEAGLSEDSTTAELKAYLQAHGSALSAQEVEYANDTDPQTGGSDNYFPAEAATGYWLILQVTNADSEKIELLYTETEEAAPHTALSVRAIATNQLAASGYYSHTHVIGLFTGTQVASGAYLTANVVTAADGTLTLADADLASLIKLNADGSVALANGATDEDVIEFITDNGSDFSAAASTSADLYKFNTGAQVQKYIKTNPNTKILVLGAAEYSDTETSWGGMWAKTTYAPEVAFEQTASTNGKNIEFNWTAYPADDIFVVNKIVYALVSWSELTAAGVNTSLLDEEVLNNFAARLEAGEITKAEADAQSANAALFTDKNGLLAQYGKTFTGDKALYTVNYGGYSGVFENMAAGDYALISLAYDSYNTKLTVSKVTVK